MKIDFIMPDEMPATKSLGLGYWRLTEPWEFSLLLTFESGEMRVIKTTVPAGFVTDLFSTPWIVQFRISRDQYDNRPALVHDWLYATCGLRADRFSPSILNCSESDLALRAAMIKVGFPGYRTFSIYRGVWLGGWITWNKYLNAGYSLAYPKLEARK